MDILKTAIFTACIIGIVSTLTDMATPNGRLKKQLSIILTMVLILGIFTPFVSGGFKLDLSGADLPDTDEYERYSEDFQDMYLTQSEENIKKALAGLLKNEGITADKIDIVSAIDEYNSLEIKKVRVYISDSTKATKDRIEKILSDNLPDTAVEFVKEESSGYQNADKKDESFDTKAESYTADSDSRDLRDSADTSFRDNS